MHNNISRKKLKIFDCTIMNKTNSSPKIFLKKAYSCKARRSTSTLINKRFKIWNIFTRWPHQYTTKPITSKKIWIISLTETITSNTLVGASLSVENRIGEEEFLTYIK